MQLRLKLHVTAHALLNFKVVIVAQYTSVIGYCCRLTYLPVFKGSNHLNNTRPSKSGRISSNRIYK